MPILHRTLVPGTLQGATRTPEHWLRLFGAVCATVFFVVFMIIFAITPIIPLPAFIDFASAASGKTSPEFEHDVTVTVRSNGHIFLQSRPITLGCLAQELEATRLQRRHEPTLRLRIDRSTPFGFVRGVADAASVAGYERFTVMVRHMAAEIPSGERTGSMQCIERRDCDASARQVRLRHARIKQRSVVTVRLTAGGEAAASHDFGARPRQWHHLS